PYEVKISQPRTATQDARTQVTAERFEEQADNMVREYHADSRSAALRKYEEALQAWQRARDRTGELRTLRKISELNRDLTQMDKARVYGERALAISREEKNAAEEAQSLLILATIRWRDDYTLARKYNDEARRIGYAIQDLQIQARSLFVLGDIHRFSGDMDGAAEAYTQAY